MIKVKDISGKELPGLFRAGNGTLIVDDVAELNRYKQQLADKQKLSRLESELSDIKELLKQLLPK